MSRRRLAKVALISGLLVVGRFAEGAEYGWALYVFAHLARQARAQHLARPRRAGERHVRQAGQGVSEGGCRLPDGLERRVGLQYLVLQAGVLDLQLHQLCAALGQLPLQLLGLDDVHGVAGNQLAVLRGVLAFECAQVGQHTVQRRGGHGRVPGAGRPGAAPCAGRHESVLGVSTERRGVGTREWPIQMEVKVEVEVEVEVKGKVELTEREVKPMVGVVASRCGRGTSIGGRTRASPARVLLLDRTRHRRRARSAPPRFST